MNRIKELRNLYNLSQEKLAEEFDVERATISRWENEKTDPSNEDLLRLAKYFKVSLDYLLGRTNNPTPPEKNNQKSENHQLLYHLKSTSEEEILNTFQETLATYGKLSKEEKERMLDGLGLINEIYKKKTKKPE